MNRTGDYRGLHPADIETVVGLPVSQELPNEYLTVSRSIARHSRIGRMTALGRAIEGLAKSIAADSLEGRTESASPSGTSCVQPSPVEAVFLTYPRSFARPRSPLP